MRTVVRFPMCFRCTQGGTKLDDEWRGAGTAVDGSIVLAGRTLGNWTGIQDVRVDGVSDLAAMAVDKEGLPLWSYQVNASLDLPCLARFVLRLFRFHLLHSLG